MTTAYHLLETKLKEKLEPEGVTVALGRIGRSKHSNAKKAVFIVPAKETFGAGVPSQALPHPAKTCNYMPVLQVRAADLAAVVELRTKIIQVLDESFHGTYTLGTGVWYDEDAQTVAGEEYRLPVQISGPVADSGTSTTELAQVTAVPFENNVLQPPDEQPPASSWSPADSP